MLVKAAQVWNAVLLTGLCTVYLEILKDWPSELFWLPVVCRLFENLYIFDFSEITGSDSTRLATKGNILLQGVIIAKDWKYTEKSLKFSPEPSSQFQLNLVKIIFNMGIGNSTSFLLFLQTSVDIWLLCSR